MIYKHSIGNIVLQTQIFFQNHAADRSFFHIAANTVPLFICKFATCKKVAAPTQLAQVIFNYNTIFYDSKKERRAQCRI